MEEWKSIPEFPGYSVSNWGSVRNDETGRILAVCTNQHGVTNVGLSKNGRQYKRSIALLVACAFLPMETRADNPFDTPINLDGNRSNNHVDNLMWRPRWFAVRYNNQFDNVTLRFVKPIREKETGATFKNSLEACMQFGLLEKQLVVSILNGSYVFPTYQYFETIGE